MAVGLSTKIGLQMRIIAVVMVLASAHSLVSATPIEDGSKAYKAGDFAQALVAYQALPQKDATIWYNMGNCYYRMGEIGRAILAWRRAEIVWPLLTSRKEVVENILYAQKKQGLVDMQRPAWWMKTHAYCYSLLCAIPLCVLQLLFLCWWFFLFWQLRRLYRRRQIVLVAFLALGIVVLGVMLVLRYSASRYAVVLEDNTALLSGPGDYRTIGMLTAGQEVVKKEHSGSYYKVRADSQLGWVEQSGIEAI